LLKSEGTREKSESRIKSSRDVNIKKEIWRDFVLYCNVSLDFIVLMDGEKKYICIKNKILSDNTARKIRAKYKKINGGSNNKQ